MANCNCHSYNWAIGARPERILTPPENLGITSFDGKSKTSIVVDACIADVIEHLWKNSIITLGCCCGHGKQAPSIILQDKASQVDSEKVRSLIVEIDDRYFQLLAWNLIDLNHMKPVIL